MLKTLQIILVLLGLVLVFVGNRFSIPFLLDAGIACLGVAMIVLGGDAILTRHIVIGRRRRGTRRVYTGVAAVLQGVQFILLGLFLIGFATLLVFNVDTRAMGQQIARHPGLPLVILGVVMLTQALVVYVGSKTSVGGGIGNTVIEPLFLRILPGTILLILALGTLAIGLFEIVAPDAFDAMGGALLEAVYGLR